MQTRTIRKYMTVCWGKYSNTYYTTVYNTYYTRPADSDFKLCKIYLFRVF